MSLLLCSSRQSSPDFICKRFMHSLVWIYDRRLLQSEAKKLLCWGEKKKEADFKDLFLSTPQRMHDIFNLFIWVKQSFQQGKPMRRDKARFSTNPTKGCLQCRTHALTQIYLVVLVVCSSQRGWWGWDDTPVSDILLLSTKRQKGGNMVMWFTTVYWVPVCYSVCLLKYLMNHFLWLLWNSQKEITKETSTTD